MQLVCEMGPVIAVGVPARLEDLLMLFPSPGDEWVHALV
jgi:hypothetical protein